MEVKKRIFYFIKAAITIYLLVLTSMYFLQEKLLFHPKKTPIDFKYEFVNSFEEKFVSGGTLEPVFHALLFKAKNPKGIILYLHGNGCNLSQCGYLADELVSKTDYDVFILDYPGYGKSLGQIKSEAQLHVLAIRALSEIRDLGYTNIVVFGRSLGSGIAVQLMARIPKHESYKNIVNKLILETPYYSIKDLALSKYPFVPPFLLKYNFRSDLFVSNVKVPVLIFHGDKDTLIPIEQSQRLSKLISDLKYVEIEDGTHDDLSSFPKYWTELDAFLKDLK